MSGKEYELPFLAVRWFNLQEILRSQLSSDCLHLNHQLTDFRQDSQNVELFFNNGETTAVDLLIGADGISSSVRKKLF